MSILVLDSLYNMPTITLVKQILSGVTFVILLLSLGAAGTSLGFLQANIPTTIMYQGVCYFFLNYSQAISLIDPDDSDTIINVSTCKLSIASASIATICLALLTAFELISVSFHINIKT